MRYCAEDPLHLARGDDRLAVESAGQSLTRRTLHDRVSEFARYLAEARLRCIALQADNGIDWIIADLACHQAAVRLVPIPRFFSAAQIRHALSSSGADALLADASVPGTAPRGFDPDTAVPGTLRLQRLPAAAQARIPPATQKITFTSGTTGEPKGVCLSAGQQFAVARSLATATGLETPRHLCVLPLSTLLENVAGIYAPLLAGGTVVVPPLAAIGSNGSSRVELPRLLAAISAEQPDTLILVPELLQALTTAAERGWTPPASLRFVAVGGGKVGVELLQRARRNKIPVFEGYGLSECTSVVTLNVGAADRQGSAGRVLPHARLHIDNGEIIVGGAVHLGYADDPDSWGLTEVRTGDLGMIDAEGFVHVQGRCGNRIITSFGRNLSPEWVESSLLAGPLLSQAVVFGDARPWCVALLHPVDPDCPDAAIAAWLCTVNRELPDYARIVDWLRLPQALTADAGLLTANGRPQRQAIERRYQDFLDKLYEQRAEASNQ